MNIQQSIGGIEMNAEVTEYIEKISQPWQVEICTQLREIILQSIPDVEERIQYSKPHYKKNGQYACVMGTAKGWVSFTIFNAQALQTPEGMFESSENGDRKTIKIKQGQAVDGELMGRLLKEASSTL
jgi:hypothetical protein